MIYKPTFNSIPLADGLCWRAGGGWVYQEKLDGCWHVEELPHGTTVIGELMASGKFFAFDCLALDGQDLRPLPLSERLLALSGLNLPQPASGPGGAFLASVLARGGEGVVRKPLDAPWGVPWEKCKRSQVYHVRVTDLDPMLGSAILADSVTGEKRGKLALRSRFELVRIGSVLKVEAFGEHKSGLLREARLDSDGPTSWLVSL